MARQSYPTDLTETEYACLAPHLPASQTRGRPRQHPVREILDAIFYLVRSGCAWRLLPHEFPPWRTVYHYYRTWRLDGTWERLHTALRDRLRRQLGREAQPSAGIIDSQSVKTTSVGGERGFDGGKKVNGRKRHIAVDTVGLLLAVVVSAASVDDAAAAPAVLAQLDRTNYPRLRKVWVDSKYHNYALYAWVNTHADG